MRQRNLHDGGYILVAALLAVGILFAAGLAVMARMTTESKLGRSAQEHEQAWQSAMAGIEHCMEHLRWGPGRDTMKNPISAPISVCTDIAYQDDRVDYSVSAVAPNNFQVTITSVGKAGKSTRTLKAVMQYTLGQGTRGKMAAWGGGPLFWGGNGTIIGDVYSESTITFAGAPEICGHMYAKISINKQPAALPGCQNAIHYPVPAVEFPPFDLQSLVKVGERVVADKVVEGDHEPTCRKTDPKPPRECAGPTDELYVVWVKGNLTLPNQASYYRGRTIYVVDGSIDVKGPVELAEQALLQLSITGDKTITVQAGGTSFRQGMFVAPQGTFVTNGVARIHGLIFARKGWNNTGNGHWISDSMTGFCTHRDETTDEVVCYGSRPAMIRLWEE